MVFKENFEFIATFQHALIKFLLLDLTEKDFREIQRFSVVLLNLVFILTF